VRNPLLFGHKATPEGVERDFKDEPIHTWSPVHVSKTHGESRQGIANIHGETDAIAIYSKPGMPILPLAALEPFDIDVLVHRSVDNGWTKVHKFRPRFNVRSKGVLQFVTTNE
jgi:hypothetical protein